jgi:hypothetical protein
VAAAARGPGRSLKSQLADTPEWTPSGGDGYMYTRYELYIAAGPASNDRRTVAELRFTVTIDGRS